MSNRFSSFYKQIILQDCALKHTIKNSFEVIKISQVILHFTSSDLVHENTFALNALVALKLLTGQQAAIFTTKKSVAAFKTRKNQLISCQVTLRGKRLFCFLDAFINIFLPRLHTSEIKQLLKQDTFLAELESKKKNKQSGKSTLAALAACKPAAVYLRNKLKRYASTTLMQPACCACQLCQQSRAHKIKTSANSSPKSVCFASKAGAFRRDKADLINSFGCFADEGIAEKQTKAAKVFEQPKQLSKMRVKKKSFPFASFITSVKNDAQSRAFQKITKKSFGIKQLLLFPQLETHFQLFETIKGFDMSIISLQKQKYSHTMLPSILCSGFQLPVFSQQEA